MMSRGHVLSILLLIVFLLPLAHAQEEQWLQYRHSREAQDILRNVESQMPDLIKSRPEHLDLPEFTDNNPIFAKWPTPMVKVGYVWLALARSREQGVYDRLYIDADCDGSLGDEEAIEPYRMDTRSSYFGPVKLVFDSDDGPISYHLNLRYYGQENYERLYVHAGGWYEGTVTVAGQPMHCVLVDQNGNGAFDDRDLDPGRADRISVGKKDNPQFRFVGKYLEVGQTLYGLEVCRDGAFVVFAPAQGVEYGEVGLPEGITRFGAGGPLGQFERRPDDGVVQLPVGEYRINNWLIARKDDQGNQWHVKGQAFGEKGRFRVSATRRTDLQVGEPLQASLQVSQDSSQYSFSQELRGSLGESIELMRNGTRPSPPKLHIRNKTGSYERTFSFEYG